MNEELAEIKGCLKGLLWGILLTIGALIFFETERGQKLKKKLKEEEIDLLEDLPGLIDKLEEKSEEWVNEASNLEKDLKEKTVEVGQSLAEEVGEKLDVSLGHIAALQEHGREITGGLKRRLFKNIPKKGKASSAN